MQELPAAVLQLALGYRVPAKKAPRYTSKAAAVAAASPPAEQEAAVAYVLEQALTWSSLLQQAR